MRRMAYTIVFRIRKCYFDEIVAGKKTREVRTLKPFWTVRAETAIADLAIHRSVVATFLCGPDKHRREVLAVKCYPTAEEALGGPLTPTGREMFGDTPVWGFDLGKVV